MEQQEPTQADHVILMRMPETSGAGDERVQTLGPRGRASARAAAGDMFGAGYHPGPLLASDTVAGREVAALIAEAAHIDPADIHFADDLLGATTDTLEVRIRALAEPYTLVTLVAHEPGISELARILSRDPRTALRPGEWRHLPWPPPF